MKLAIFSDLHLHPFATFAKIDEHGYNTRLYEIATALTRIIIEAEKAKCAAILFAGDFFHTKKLDIETLDIAARALETCNLPIYAIAGNHDEADQVGALHSIRALRNLRILENDCAVIEERGEAMVVGGIPYVGSQTELRHRIGQLTAGGHPDILLLHTAVTGGMMGADFVLDDNEFMGADDLLVKGRLTVCGHFHMPTLFQKDRISLPPPMHPERGGDASWRPIRKEGAVLIPGAPVQHTFGDAESNRGYWIYDDKHDDLDFVPIPGPRFMRIEWADLAPGDGTKTFRDMKDAYVELIFDRDVKQSTVLEAQAEFGWKAVRGVMKPKESAVAELRVDITPATKQEDVISKYAAQFAPKEDVDGYVEAGNILMGGVE